MAGLGPARLGLARQGKGTILWRFILFVQVQPKWSRSGTQIEMWPTGSENCKRQTLSR